jgi:hypothetical protein
MEKLGGLLETPESLSPHSVTRKGERDGLRRERIGQSAAERPVEPRKRKQAEGSSTRRSSPKEPAHEYPEPFGAVI